MFIAVMGSAMPVWADEPHPIGAETIGVTVTLVDLGAVVSTPQGPDCYVNSQRVECVPENGFLKPEDIEPLNVEKDTK